MFTRQSRSQPIQYGVRHEGAGPSQVKKVMVEHSSGAFVPSELGAQLRQKEMEQNKLLAALEAMTAWTTSKEDAKNYEPFLEQFVFGCRRLLELLVGFCAGFSIFLLLSVYAVSGNRDYANFLQVYSMHYVVTQKVFFASSLVGVFLAIVPFAHDAGLTRRREIGQKGKDEGKDAAEGVFRRVHDFMDQQGLTPFRRLGNIQLWAFVGCLIASIITTSVEQGRTPDDIRGISPDLVSRLHIAIIVRGAFHIIAWLAVFFAPLPPPSTPIIALDEHEHGSRPHTPVGTPQSHSLRHPGLSVGGSGTM